MSLSAGMPDWVVELGAVAARIQAGVASLDSVGASCHVRASVPHQDHLTVTVAEPAGADRAAAMDIATALAALWPGWLDEWSVGLEVVTPHLIVRADVAAMLALAGGEVGAAEWLIGAERVDLT